LNNPNQIKIIRRILKMTLVKFATNKKENSLNPWFNDVFESYFNDSLISNRTISRVPAVNISETENGYQVELAVPGLKKEDFKINVDKNILNVSAENKSTSDESKDSKKYNRIEYSYSTFTRSFTLPESVDHSKINAEYTDGILRITVAKKEEAKFLSREISIK
jgi:HSP20 family protein